MTGAYVSLPCPRCGWLASGRFAQDLAEALGELAGHLRYWHALSQTAAEATLARARRVHLTATGDEAVRDA
jgi:predicted small metal-binding protein